MLEIFPERMLDSSLHTSILLGIVLLWICTETFGWVFAGFIVPGYLASMAIVAPISLLCIMIESILTYGAAYILGSGASHLKLWHNVFGRERFLLFILVSIPIRILVEGELALPIEAVLALVSDNPSIQSGRFFGIGMVLVPLLANSWWKTGLSKGLLQMSVVTSVCYLILEYGFSQYTNFHFGGFELTFENIATDFLSIPKPYIILVMTAILSARNNIRYGWNFGGILLPSLLAVVALSPLKFGSTLMEIILLTVLYRWLVRLPIIRNLNLSGPRQIVSMYTLAFLLKWMIAQLAEAWSLNFYISDFYGFGYLLTSLVAIRCLNESIPRTMLPLLYTTGQGLLLGLGLSLWLSYLLPTHSKTGQIAQTTLTTLSLEQSILQSTSSIRDRIPDEGLSDNQFNKNLQVIRRLVQTQDAGGLSRAAEELKDPSVLLEWAIREDNQRCLAIKPNRSGAEMGSVHPSFWWCGGQGPGLVSIHPKTDPDSLWLTAWLAQHARPSFVLVGSIDLPESTLNENGTEVQLLRRRFQQIRSALGSRTVLLTRSGTESYLDPRSAETAGRLRGRLGPLSNPPIRFESIQGPYQMWWDNLYESDGLLQLSPSLLDSAPAMAQPNALEPQTLEDWLQGIIINPTHKIAGAESIQHRFAITDTLLELTNRLAKTTTGPPPPSLYWLAEQFDIQISHIVQNEQEFWTLQEREKTPSGFGFWVFRLGQPDGWLLMVPNSADERGAPQLGIQLLKQLDARVYWMSGHGTYFGTSSLLRAIGEQAPLQPLMLRELLRNEADSPNLLLLRRQPAGAWDTTMLQISFGIETLAEAEIQTRLSSLSEVLKWWPNYDFENGRRVTSAMNTSGQFPVKYMSAQNQGEVITLWLAPEAMTELDGSQEKQHWKEWYAEHNISWLKEDTYTDYISALGTTRTENPEIQDILHNHANTRAESALKLLQRFGKVSVLDSNVRLTYAIDLGTMTCLATGGTKPKDAFPYAGCWRK